MTHISVPVELLRSLVGDEGCRYDHNRDCQTHLFFGLDGEPCPHEVGGHLLNDPKALREEKP